MTVLCGTSSNKPYFNVFQFKEKEFIYDNEFLLGLSINYTRLCYQLHYKADYLIAQQQILEADNNNEIVINTEMTKALIKIELSACLQNNFMYV